MSLPMVIMTAPLTPLDMMMLMWAPSRPCLLTAQFFHRPLVRMATMWVTLPPIVLTWLGPLSRPTVRRKCRPNSLVPRLISPSASLVARTLWSLPVPTGVTSSYGASMDNKPVSDG